MNLLTNPCMVVSQETKTTDVQTKIQMWVFQITKSSFIPNEAIHFQTFMQTTVFL